jgi:hypothetical protein
MSRKRFSHRGQVAAQNLDTTSTLRLGGAGRKPAPGSAQFGCVNARSIRSKLLRHDFAGQMACDNFADVVSFAARLDRGIAGVRRRLCYPFRFGCMVRCCRNENEQFFILKLLLLHPWLIAFYSESGESFKAHGRDLICGSESQSLIHLRHRSRHLWTHMSARPARSRGEPPMNPKAAKFVVGALSIAAVPAVAR